MKSVKIANDVFFAFAKEILKQGKPVDIRVKGHSMKPFLWEGEVVTIVPINEDTELKRGHIILADTDLGRVMMHRICRMEDRRIVMRGDGNLFQREFISRSQVIGLASSVKRNGKDVPLYSFGKRMAAEIWSCYPIRRIGLFLIRIFRC